MPLSSAALFVCAQAYPYIASAGGLETELSYPYTGTDGRCKFKPSKVSQTVSGFHNVVPPCLGALNTCKENEKGLANATAYVKNSGPVSICVNAGPWQTYMGGVLSTGCSPAHAALDHCVQLTGYGRSSEGVEYWSVRNSWGASWGLGGYIRIAQKNNICGESPGWAALAGWFLTSCPHAYADILCFVRQVFWMR